MMFTVLLIAALCFVSGQAYIVKVKVDDIHKLYANGQLVSSGGHWSQEYTASISWAPVLALYAENISGPKGFKLTIDDQATHTSQWKCKAVSSENQISGWQNTHFTGDSSWGGIVGQGSPGVWAAEGGNKCVCRLKVVELQIQVDDEHVLYSDGQLVSTGNWWSYTYELVVAHPQVLALYAKNISGAKGFIITFNGDQITSGWKCKSVSGQHAISGWYTTYYDDSNWGSAKYESNSNTWMWASEGGDHIYCRKTLGQG